MNNGDQAKLKPSRIIFSIVIIAATILLLLQSAAAIQAARRSIEIWYKNVLPSLLPFFILTSAMSSSGIISALSPAFSGVMRFFRLPGECALVSMLGAISGYPVGARLTGEMLKRGEIDLFSAERLLILSNFPSPMFVMGSVAFSLLGNADLGVPMLLPQYISALIISIIWARLKKQPRETQKKSPNTGSGNRYSKKAQSFEMQSSAEIITKAAGDGMIALLRVCGLMIFASVLYSILDQAGLISVMISPFEGISDKETLRAVLIGLFEMSEGCQSLSRLSVDPPVIAALCSFVIGFGGLSVTLQTLSFAQVRARVIILSKAIQGLLSAIISYIWISNIELPVAAFSGADMGIQKLNWLPAAFCVSIFLALFMLARFSNRLHK